MVLSFALMGIAIVGLALTPSYAQIGIAAPVLLVVFRLVQGFALGGEVGPSTAFLVESAPPDKRGLFVSIQATGCGDPVRGPRRPLALERSVRRGTRDLWDGGWPFSWARRCAAGLYLRRSLPETLTIEKQAGAAPETAAAMRRIPLVVIVLSLLIFGSNTIATYTMNY